MLMNKKQESKMLKYKETDGLYIIEENIISALKTDKKRVYYTKDLMFKKVDNDPWRSTTDSDREWFEKHYKHKF